MGNRNKQNFARKRKEKNMEISTQNRPLDCKKYKKMYEIDCTQSVNQIAIFPNTQLYKLLYS